MDTLQIFFAWDDDFYTYFKEQGLGKKGIGCKVLPLVYTDNCESTTGVAERRRKFVILPERFGETYQGLRWEETDRKNEPIIKSEKPKVQISLEDNEKYLKFKIIPRIDEKEQYHIEYSSRSVFGSTYGNWSIIVLRMADFQDLLLQLGKHFPDVPSVIEVPIYEESKQEQREKFFFVKIPIKSYKFSLGEFLYAKKYMELNGISGTLPSLIYEDTPSYKEKMNPVLKVGLIHTTEEQGFEVRPPQCAIKVTQHKFSISKRGKEAKMKGKIVTAQPYENYFFVPAKEFYVSALAIANKNFDTLDKVARFERTTAKKCSKP